MNFKPPSVVIINLTNKCNLNCTYCYQESGLKEEDENVMGIEEKRNLIDQLYKIGVKTIGFSGGEPLLDKDLFEILEYSTQKGIYTSLMSNGTLLTKNVTRKLKEYGLNQVSINIDSADKKIHDFYRNKNGCWKTAIDGVINANNNNLRTKISATITKGSISGLEDLLNLAKSLRCDEFEFAGILPIGRGKYLKEECLSREDMVKLFEFATRCIANEDISITTIEPECYIYVKKNLPLIIDLNSSNFGCAAGRYACAIQPNGDVTPCVFTPNLSVGNVREKNFREIWYKSKLFEKLRDPNNLEGRCGNCDENYLCFGCRARAYAMTGDIFAEDPCCTKNRH